MRIIVLTILLAALVNAQLIKYKFCVPKERVSENSCIAVEKGNSEILCYRAEDSAECAIRLGERDVDFAVFDAEELLLAYPFYQNDIIPILQLRHMNRVGERFDFQTVAVVHKQLTQDLDPPNKKFEKLRNGGLCHPGFSKSQRWTDFILKYFEKVVIDQTSRQCHENMSVVENEVRNLRNFFGKACRPGDWASDSSIDQSLKKKYPELCALCDDKENCTYNNDGHHGHHAALECLAKGQGKVAYVALSYVQKYLRTNGSFEFLCPDGERYPLNTPNPCTWIRQPWKIIAARTGDTTRNEVANTLLSKLSEWLKPDSQKEPWQNDLNKIIRRDSYIFNMSERSLSDYLNNGRSFDLTLPQTCDRTIRWCTVSNNTDMKTNMETNKCNWVARAMKAIGIEPQISCVQSNSVLECLSKITTNQADVITIDSNYGYMARKVYGLSPVLYCDTESVRNSRVIAVMRHQTDNNYPIKNFQDMKGKTACFPEYAGISWLSFVNIARKMGIVSAMSCDYPLLMSKLFSGACTPGIKDRDHWSTSASEEVSNKLCSACTRNQNNTSCAASHSTNRYYHDNGAMTCLEEHAGDVAFVELGNINDEKINVQNNYHILCKNGSLAANSGFKIDDGCPLSVTIDSEVVGRKNNSEASTRDILLAFLKMEEWLGYGTYPDRPIHAYGPFNGTFDLLFKDSTSGLVSTSAMLKTVEAYKDLFSHVFQCSNAHLAVTANYIFVALIALYHILSSHV